MAYIDDLNLFSDEQAITVTAPSTDVIDLGVDRDIGSGEPIELVIKVNEAFTADGAGTLTIDVQTDNAVGFGTASVIASSGAIGKAALTLGSEHLKIRVPSTTKRYLRLNYTVATGPMTAGKITAGLQLSRQDNRAYPSGFTVD
jgi:hypothetical protein